MRVQYDLLRRALKAWLGAWCDWLSGSDAEDRARRESIEEMIQEYRGQKWDNDNMQWMPDPETPGAALSAAEKADAEAVGGEG